MKKNIYIYRGIAASTILLILVGSALSMDSFPVVVNLMIDINAPISPNSIEEQIAFDSIVNLTNGIGPKGLNAILYFQRGRCDTFSEIAYYLPCQHVKL